MLSSIRDTEPMSRKDCEIRADKYLQAMLQTDKYFATISYV